MWPHVQHVAATLNYPNLFSLQLFPCSAIECSCCLWGIDLSVGGALPSMEKNSAHTLPSVSSLVFCLLCSPSAEEPSDVPIISNKTAIAHQRQVKSSFIPLHRHCLPTRPNAYCATRRFPGISLVVFPRKIAIKKGGRKAEIGIVVDQYVPPAELSSHTVRAFTDLDPKGNPGEIPTWTWTAWEGLEGEERRRKQRSESYMCLLFSIFNTSSFTFFFLLFSAAGRVSNVTVYWAASRYCYFTMDMGLQEILIFKKTHTLILCVRRVYTVSRRCLKVLVLLLPG